MLHTTPGLPIKQPYNNSKWCTVHWLGTFPMQINAVRNCDFNAVDRYTAGPGFVSTSAEAGQMTFEAVWCREPKRMMTLLLSRSCTLTGRDQQGTSITLLDLSRAPYCYVSYGVKYIGLVSLGPAGPVNHT